MESIDAWFKREVLQWRSGAAVAWSLISLPVITGIYLLFTCLQPVNPFSTMADFLSLLFTVSFMFMVAVFIVINGLFFIYNSRTFTVFPGMATTKIRQLMQLGKMPHILHCGVSSLCGAVLAWVCTTLLGSRYTHLYFRCAEDSELYCINEYHLFLVMYGAYMGVMYVFYHNFKQQNYLQFPQLQQAKFFQVRGRLLEVFVSSVGHVVNSIGYFYIFYFFLGGFPRDWISEILSLRFGSDYRLNTIYGLLLDFPLLWQTFLLGLLLQFSWSSGALLYRVYVTEHFEFSISTMFDNFKNKCLVDAMSCTHAPLVQYLGFYDLDTLSKYSFTRRKELFSLSQPGGHPHNWNKIVAVCLSVVNELTDQIQDANWKILASVPVRQQNGDKQMAQNVTSVGNGHVTDSTNKLSQQQSINLRDRVITTMKKLPFVNSFTSDVPQTKNKSLFLSSQIQIWAVEALSSLVAASYSEDSYGVVQMSLTDIITAILNLQENIEKHFKLTGGVARRSQKDTPAGDVTLKFLLQSTVKSSIYRIINTFGNHIMELHLPVETEKKIRHFIEYRE